MERLQEERKVHRMAAAAAAAAAMRCRTARCSSTAGRRRDRRQNEVFHHYCVRVLSTRRHAAHPASVPILHAREVPGTRSVVMK